MNRTVIKAAYDTVCGKCERPVRKGDQIVRNTAGIWGDHETCPGRTS